MQFIDLAKKLRTECGVTGTDTTVVGATGEWGRLCGWIADEWLNIQLSQTDWKWMRKTTTFDTVVSQGTYTLAQAAATDHAEWMPTTFRIYLKATGESDEQHLTYMEYDDFRNLYLFGTTRTNESRPTHYTIAPDDSLILGQLPDAIYTIEADYHSVPIILAADADTPAMPERFHLLIVYSAMMNYGAFEVASEVYEAGKAKKKLMKSQLLFDQLPRFGKSRSLI